MSPWDPSFLEQFAGARFSVRANFKTNGVVASQIFGVTTLDALAPADTGAAVDVDVVHPATISADAAAEIASQRGENGAVLAARRMEVGSATRGMKAAPTAAGNAGPFAKC